MKSVSQNYYCIVTRKKFGDYELVTRKSTSNYRITIRLKSRGYRVLICLSKQSLLRLQNLSLEEFHKIKYKWSDKAYDFIQSIDLLEEDK